MDWISAIITFLRSLFYPLNQSRTTLLDRLLSTNIWIYKIYDQVFYIVLRFLFIYDSNLKATLDYHLLKISDLGENIVGIYRISKMKV